MAELNQETADYQVMDLEWETFNLRASLEAKFPKVVRADDLVIGQKYKVIGIKVVQTKLNEPAVSN